MIRKKVSAILIQHRQSAYKDYCMQPTRQLDVVYNFSLEIQNRMLPFKIWLHCECVIWATIDNELMNNFKTILGVGLYQCWLVLL